MKSARTFRIPQDVSSSQQVAFCLSIIQKQRDELAPLRKRVTLCDTSHSAFIDTLMEWKNRYKHEKNEKEQWKDRYEKAQKQNEELKREIERMTKTENRLNQAVFAHGNFHHPDKQDKKPNGGQEGHADTNRDKNRNRAVFTRQRIYAACCGKCGSPLNRVNSVKEKIFIDIQVNTQIIQMILESERQWCVTCRKEVNARSPQALPFTEYGINVFLIILLMRFRAHQSISSISETLFYGFGLRLAESVILSMLHQAKKFLQGKYDELVQAIRDGDVMYNDETGWLIKGDKAYMWIMSSADTKDADGNVIPGKTVYVAAQTRGIGVFEEMYGCF